jgi:hypothetical protein
MGIFEDNETVPKYYISGVKEVCDSAPLDERATVMRVDYGIVSTNVFRPVLEGLPEEASFDLVRYLQLENQDKVYVMQYRPGTMEIAGTYVNFPLTVKFNSFFDKCVEAWKRHQILTPKEKEWLSDCQVVASRRPIKAEGLAEVLDEIRLGPKKRLFRKLI